MMSRIAPAVILLSTLAAASAPAYDCMRTVDRLAGGPAQGVAVIGDAAVVGTGSRLVVVDISVPLEPAAVAELGFGEPSPSPFSVLTCVTPLAALDEIVVLSESCGGSPRLVIVDLSAPTAPAIASSLELVLDNAGQAVVSGSVAWVVESVVQGNVISKALTAVDLTDPDAPLVVGRYEGAPEVDDLSAAGSVIALVESRRARLTLLDVRSPSNPSVLSQTTIAATSSKVLLTSDRVYLSTNDTIEVLDVSDPAVPAPVMSVPWLRVAGPSDLLAVGDRLFLGLVDVDPIIAEPGGGLEVFDLADPSSSASRQSIVFSSGGSGLAASDGRLLVVDRHRGLRVFELDQLTSPIQMGLVNPTFDAVAAVAVEGDLAIVADSGLRTIDLAHPTGPRILGGLDLDLTAAYDPDANATVETGRSTWDVDAGPGGLAVLAASDGVLVVVDLSDPQHPVELGRIELEHLASSPTRVALSGSLAAVAGYTTEGLTLVDLSDPAHPTELGRGIPSGGASAVALVGDLAVVAVGPWSFGTGHHGLDVFDVSDPSAPVLVGSIELARPVTVLASLGSLVVGAGREGLSVVDLTDPANPDEIGSLETPLYTVSGIATDGRRAYVASRPGSFAAFDLADPEHPRLLGRTTWQPFTIPDGGPTGGYGAAIHDSRAVVADGTFGVRILDSSLCFDRPQVPQGHASVE